MNAPPRLPFALVLSLVLALPACADEDDDPSYRSYDGGSPSTGSALDEHPSWLADKAWTKGYKLENNVSFESEDLGIRLGAGPGFTFETKTGKSWSKSGTWKVSGGRLVLGTESLAIATAFDANCRILKRANGTVLHAADRIEGCPSKKPLGAAECKKTGTYAKSSTSGSSSSSTSTYSSYELDRDGVLTFTSGSSRTTCYDTTCKSLSSSSAPAVSRWWLSGSSVSSDGGTVNLGGFTFTPSTETCP